MTTVEAKKRAPIIFGILVVLQVLLISVQARPGQGQQSLLRSAILTVFAPVMKITSWAGGNVSYVWYNYASLRHAKEENDQLREENTRLRQESLKADQSTAEADRLRKILSLQPTLPVNSVVGHVVTRDTSLWVDRISIDRGSLSGVQKNFPVITPEGVVGHVVAVSPYFAQVQLITDERAGAGARLKTSRTLGEIRGTNGPFPELRNVSNLEDIQPGEEVITSGLDGIYPQGLLIGKVLSAQKRTDDVTQKILIQPAAHLSGFEEVMILQVDPNELHAQIQEALAPATPTTKGEKKPAAKTAGTGKASTKPTGGEKKTDAGRKPDAKKKSN